MDKSLRGKCAIVTGAASGIGKASAEALTASGAEVLGFDLIASSAAFDVIFCDVSSESSVKTAVAEAARDVDASMCST